VKALSSHATDLLARLTRPLTWRERVAGRAEDAVDADVRVLSELAGLAEPALVPHLVALVFDGPAPVRRAAAEVLDRALAAATAPDLVQLDEACRR
jgi:hypothetical protein